MPFIGILVIIASLVALISPHMSWWLSEGWKFRNAKPSGLYLTFTRIGGVIGLVVGTLFLLSSI
jgi:hypothetical protein